MNRRTRPSSGCALRAAGNEMAKRSGPAVCARVREQAPPAIASDTAQPSVSLQRCIGISWRRFYRRVHVRTKPRRPQRPQRRLSQRPWRSLRFLLRTFYRRCQRMSTPSLEPTAPAQQADQVLGGLAVGDHVDRRGVDVVVLIVDAFFFERVDQHLQIGFGDASEQLDSWRRCTDRSCVEF